MATYIFTPPYTEETPNGAKGVFAYLLKIRNGVSIGKVNGTYFRNQYPIQDEIDAYQEFYSGGHKHSVSESTKTALLAAGVGVTEANFTIE
jgi:hypothetical protein